MYDHLTTKEQLTKRLEELWVKATSSCGKATTQILDEIHEIEKRLDALDDK